MTGYVRAPERREQYLQAAIAVLVADGLDSLTLRRVAAQAGVRLSQLQYIFPTRAELLSAMYAEVLSQSGFGELPPGNNGLAQELRSVLDWYQRDVLTNPAMVELLRSEFVAALGRREPATLSDATIRDALAGGQAGNRIEQVATASTETYKVPVAEVATLWNTLVSGLTMDYLAHGDLERFRRDSEVAVAGVLAAAGVDGFRPRVSGI